MLAGLEQMYGRVAEPRRRSGLDALVEAMLAQNTNMVNAARGYRMLRRRFSSWTAVMTATVDDVQREIAICGLARMRAKRLQNLLRVIKARRGRLTLEFLAREPVGAAFDYLMGFYGVGPKTAAFTLLFGLGRPVLPVDNGVLRVVRRLGLVRPKARDLEAERVLTPLIDEGSHYAAHVLMFRHAGQRCRPRNPKCRECALLDQCPHGRRVIRHRPPARGAAPTPTAATKPPPRRVRPRLLARFASAGIPKEPDRE